MCPFFREPDGRSIDVSREVGQVETRSSARCKPENHCSDGTIRRIKNNELGYKPLGLQTRIQLLGTRGKLLLDADLGIWLYRTNSAFYDLPRPVPQNEQRIGSLEGHLSHDFKYGTWDRWTPTGGVA